jgi:hypothetical protein
MEKIKLSTGETLLVRKVNDQSDADWYGVTKDHVLLTIEGLGWFPTAKIAGVNQKGIFYDKYGIGMRIHGNLGSASIAVMDLERSIKLLESPT